MADNSINASVKEFFIQIKEGKIDKKEGIRMISKLIYRSPDAEIILDLRDCDLESIGSEWLNLYLDKDKTLRIKAKNIGPFFGCRCNGTIIIEEAENIGGGAFQSSTGKLILKKYKSLNLKNFAEDCKGTVIIKDLVFNYFNDESFNAFSLEIYPKLNKGASKNIPIQFIPLFSNYDFSLERLRDSYLRIFKEAKHFMQRLSLKMNVNAPSLYISHIDKAVIEGISKDVAGDYNNPTRTIRIFGGPFPDKTIFHELMHSILYAIFPESIAQKVYSEKFEIKIPLSDDLIVERNSRYVVEGITDFLTKHYYANYDKERKYDLNSVAFGYPEELEFIGKILLDFVSNKKMTFEDAIKIILNVKITLDSIISKLKAIKDEFKAKMAEEIISKLSNEEFAGIINEEKDQYKSYDNKLLSLIIITSLNLEKCTELYTRELEFPIELKKGTINTKFWSQEIIFRINGGTINILNDDIEKNRFDCSMFNKGFINLISVNSFFNIKNGIINSKSFEHLTNNESVAVAEKINSIKDNKGIVNAGMIKNIVNNSGVIIIQEYFGDDETYNGNGKNELLELNNEILSINRGIIQKLRRINENNYAQISKEINQLNKEQEIIIEKEIEIIKKYDVAGIVANSPEKEDDKTVKSAIEAVNKLNYLIPPPSK